MKNIPTDPESVEGERKSLLSEKGFFFKTTTKKSSIFTSRLIVFSSFFFLFFFRASGTSPGLGIERFITETWPAARAADLEQGRKRFFLFSLLFLTLGFINPKRKVQKGEKGGKKRILSFLARGKMGRRREVR